MFEFFSKYALYIFLALGVGFFTLTLYIHRSCLKINLVSAFLLGVVYTLFGVLSVKLFAFLESGFNGSAFGNMSIFGAVFFMPLCFYSAAKLIKAPAREMFDIVTPAMLAVLALMRVNCLLSGCCRGVLLPGAELRFPAREAEILFYAVLIAYFCYRMWKNKINGSMYPLYMLSYGVFRFIVELFREAEPQTLFHLTHVWALLSAVLGAAIYFEIKNMKIKKNH